MVRATAVIQRAKVMDEKKSEKSTHFTNTHNNCRAINRERALEISSFKVCYYYLVQLCYVLSKSLPISHIFFRVILT